MLPRPHRNKKQKVIYRKGNREVIQAEVFGYEGKYIDAPGGGGGYQALFIKQVRRDMEWFGWDCAEFERSLKKYGEEIGVRNMGNNHNGRTFHQGQTNR